MRGLLLSVGLLAAVFALVHPERYLRDFGEHLDPFRTPVVFAQQADAICADLQRSEAVLQQVSVSDPDLRLPVGSAKGMEAMRRFAARWLSVVEREVAKLHDLALPTKNREVAEKWIAAHDRFVVLVGRLRDAAQRKDMRAFMIAGLQLDANQERLEKLALKLGMNVCSNVFRGAPDAR